MNKRLTFYLFSFVIFAFSSIASAENKIRINDIEMFDHFVMSEQAARKCSKPTERQINKHVRDTALATINAMKKIRELNPTYSEQDVRDVITNRYKMLWKKFKVKFKDGGCDNPIMKDLLVLYKVQANLEIKLD